MKLPRFLVITTATLAFLAACSAEEPYSGEPFPTEDGWLTSYEQAVQEARASGKPVLANFTGSDWCQPCMQQKAEVFSEPEFKEWAQENVVLLELDFPVGKAQSPQLEQQNAELQEKFGAKGFPIVMLLDVAGDEPEVVARWNGYIPGMGAEQWIGRAEGPVEEATRAPSTDDAA